MGGAHEFSALVVGASASCGRDLIATVYRLRVAIATPRIELGDLPRNATADSESVEELLEGGIRSRQVLPSVWRAPKILAVPK